MTTTSSARTPSRRIWTISSPPTPTTAGVHLNSGIPNRVFALAATSVGGPAWESVGQVWYSVLTGSEITQRTDFAEFAELTIAEAADQFGAGSDVHDAVVSGWEAVGISHAGSARGNPGSSW